MFDRAKEPPMVTLSKSQMDAVSANTLVYLLDQPEELWTEKRLESQMDFV